MSSSNATDGCGYGELLPAHVLESLSQQDAAAVEAHVPHCEACRQELKRLRPVVAFLTAWPTDVLRAPSTLQERLAQRIAAETGCSVLLPPPRTWKEPEWEEVAPGIFCKILATDTERDRVSLLVRLLPGVSYPPHVHAGVEELHLLQGELWIGERLLRPGDYNYGEPGASDLFVYSETGCSCVLITSPSDILR